MTSMRGKATPWYGKIKCVNNPEAAAIWRTRDEEPPLCEPFGLYQDFVIDDQSEDKQMASLVIALIGKLPRRKQVVLSMRYLMDCSWQEISDAIGVSTERCRQIERQSIRDLRMAAVAAHLM